MIGPRRRRMFARRKGRSNMKLFLRKRRPGIEPGAAEVDEHQILVDGGYSPDRLVVAANRPVRLVFHRHDESACSEEVVFPDQGVRATLDRHADVVVELPPSQPGDYEFHCGMGMLHGRLVVR